MPNYQTGTLLASAGDVYTQLMEVLKTYVEARGWTTNLFENYRANYAGDSYTGKRLHAQKTINTIDRFINIRSMKNQQIFERSGNINISGLGVIASTDYDGATTSTALVSVTNNGGFASFNCTAYVEIGDTVTVSGTGVGAYDTTHTVTAKALGGSAITSTAYISNPGAVGNLAYPSRWDRMTGYTWYDLGSISDAQGGGAIALPEDVLTYFLFSENSGDNIYLICGNPTGFTGISFGTTDTGSYFVGGSKVTVVSGINTNTFMCNNDETQARGALALRKKDDSDWNKWSSNSQGVGEAAIPRIDETSTDQDFTFVQQLLFCSPDNFKGNNPLIPFYLGIIVAIKVYTFAGDIPGIKLVNMRNMDSLTELTFGGDVYKLFRLYTADDANDATLGFAILK